VNVVDEGPQSSEVAIIVATKPDQPDPPTKTSASTSSISIEWVAPHDGGSPLTNFLLLMNSGTGSTTYTQIADITDISVTTYTKSGLTSGQDYKFKIIAVNLVDESTPSNPSPDITAAVVPDAPGDPTYLSSTQTSI